MEKLIKIQSELKAPKNNFNKFGGYKYRSQEDILEAVKPLLKKYDCLLTITDTMEVVEGRVYVRAAATIFDGENTTTTEAYAREADTKKGWDDAQITGSASSYARKYALNGMFLIDDTKDLDGDIPPKEKKDTLKENTEMYKSAVNYLREGGSMAEIEKRFKVSETLKKKINDEIQVQ